MNEPLIELRDLSKVYSGEGVSTQALQRVNFQVNEGEFISIMGPSGSGKSTLLHVIGFLDTPTAGQYYFLGEDTYNFSGEKRADLRNKKIGFVFQAFFLLPRVSVLENVMLPLHYSELKGSEKNDRALEALEKVRMTHRLEHSPAQLSGGEKQRVVIARALVNRPSLIMADEPTGNLDTHSGQIVMETIASLHREGQTIIVITHETPTAEYAERIVQLEDGKVVADREASKIKARYKK